MSLSELLHVLTQKAANRQFHASVELLTSQEGQEHKKEVIPFSDGTSKEGRCMSEFS